MEVLRSEMLLKHYFNSLSAVLAPQDVMQAVKKKKVFSMHDAQ